MQSAEEATKANTQVHILVAMNYSGRSDILQVCKIADQAFFFFKKKKLYIQVYVVGSNSEIKNIILKQHNLQLVQQILLWTRSIMLGGPGSKTMLF